MAGSSSFLRSFFTTCGRGRCRLTPGRHGWRGNLSSVCFLVAAATLDLLTAWPDDPEATFTDVPWRPNPPAATNARTHFRNAWILGVSRLAAGVVIGQRQLCTSLWLANTGTSVPFPNSGGTIVGHPMVTPIPFRPPRMTARCTGLGARCPIPGSPCRAPTRRTPRRYGLLPEALPHPHEPVALADPCLDFVVELIARRHD